MEGRCKSPLAAVAMANSAHETNGKVTVSKAFRWDVIENLLSSNINSTKTKENVL